MTSKLPPVTLSITTGTDSTVSSSFLSPTSVAPPSGAGMSGSKIHYIYVTEPQVNLKDDIDLKHYQKATSTAPLPSFPAEGGTTCAILDFPPNPTGEEAKLHRTSTLDYIFIMEGTFEVSLDDGEKRIVRKGDVVIQRSSMHAWRNISATEPARFASVLVGIEGAVAGHMEFASENKQ